MSDDGDFLGIAGGVGVVLGALAGVIMGFQAHGLGGAILGLFIGVAAGAIIGPLLFIVIGLGIVFLLARGCVSIVSGLWDVGK